MAELKVLFVAGFGPLVRDHQESLQTYAEDLGLPLVPMAQQADYYHCDTLEGVKHFALWPLRDAAQSCFGREDWPEDIPTPQAWLEFEVDDPMSFTESMKSAGHQLLVEGKREPWGQTVTRFLSPEGILLSLTHTPWLRGDANG